MRRSKRYANKSPLERFLIKFFAYTLLTLIMLGIIAWGLTFLYQLAQPYLHFVYIAGGLIVGFILFWKIRGILKRKNLTGELENHLQEALQSMDGVSNAYTDEYEANKELVVFLKALGHNAIYGFRLPNGKTADAKVDNVLIEGKLSPTEDEVDRLIGQLEAYCHYPYKVNLVIYGELKTYHADRIKHFIEERYYKRVFLTYLKNPNRKRLLRTIPNRYR